MSKLKHKGDIINPRSHSGSWAKPVFEDCLTSKSVYHLSMLKTLRSQSPDHMSSCLGNISKSLGVSSDLCHSLTFSIWQRSCQLNLSVSPLCCYEHPSLDRSYRDLQPLSVPTQLPLIHFLDRAKPFHLCTPISKNC